MAVARVHIQPKNSSVDRIIDALAQAWNEQERDEGARAYFLAWHRMYRAKLVQNSLYRYPERDRAFLARHLRDFADSIYEAVAPFV